MQSYCSAVFFQTRSPVSPRMRTAMTSKSVETSEPVFGKFLPGSFGGTSPSEGGIFGAGGVTGVGGDTTTVLVDCGV